jgi:hypothetical protein
MLFDFHSPVRQRFLYSFWNNTGHNNRLFERFSSQGAISLEANANLGAHVRDIPFWE